MAQIRVLLLRAAGTNCDAETRHAWELAGARVTTWHVRELSAAPARLHEYQILTIPGGFSYGDDIAAGRIFAAQFERYLLPDVRRFVEDGKLVLGICNGFQVLVRARLLPFFAADGPRECTITYNRPPGFQARWVNLRAGATRCAFLEAGREYELPIAHGEGRVALAGNDVLTRIEQGGHKALTYSPSPPGAGVTPGAPVNPNGSAADIAGLCDQTGRVLGLMPHPERFVTATQHPCWARGGVAREADGLKIFQRAAAFFA